MIEINTTLLKLKEQSNMAKRGFITKYTSLSGVITSRKNNTHVWFESGLEKDFSLLMEYHPSVNHYTEQPVTIEYQLNDRTRIYTPDFLVKFADSEIKSWLCEIKYRDDLRLNFSKFKPRFKAAVEFCKAEGWEFRIFTEEQIRTPFLENLKFLHKYEYDHMDASCYQLVINRVRDLGLTSPREIFTTLDDANDGIKSKCIYALWYALKISTVECDYSKPLSLDTEIWIKP